jgi:hypothetical protein
MRDRRIGILSPETIMTRLQQPQNAIEKKPLPDGPDPRLPDKPIHLPPGLGPDGGDKDKPKPSPFGK